jgi:membrane associated rhomboid family serine protease
VLVLYFVSGVLGEIFAYIWTPNGAGSSLAIAGVIGGLFAFTFLHRQEIRGFLSIFALCGLVGAGVLSFYRDNHGPPILIGALLASVMDVLWPTRFNERKGADSPRDKSNVMCS